MEALEHGPGDERNEQHLGAGEDYGGDEPVEWIGETEEPHAERGACSDAGRRKEKEADPDQRGKGRRRLRTSSLAAKAPVASGARRAAAARRFTATRRSPAAA